MAGFAQGPWVDGVQQHSLRCISGEQNKVGARAYTNFKDGVGRYSHSRNAPPGKCEQYRSYPHKQLLPTNEKFIVQPNFDSFKPTGDSAQDAVNAAIRKTVRWCGPANPKAKAKTDCTNDGRFFHIEKLINNGANSEKGSAYVAWPHSSNVISTWRVDNEEHVMQEYHVRLIILGEGDDEQVQATVGLFPKKVVKSKNGNWRNEWQELDKRSNNLKGDDTLALGVDESFTLRGDLPRGLKIERKLGAGCGTFRFTYGDAEIDGSRSFAFKSNNKGLGTWSHTPKGPNSGRYCLKEEIKDKEGNREATILRCSFPGW